MGGSKTKPLQNINENTTIDETVTMEKPEDKTPSDEGTSDEIEEDEDQNKDNESATVHIDHDSSHISLSACNYDHSLLNYLQSHPLTSSSACVDGDEPVLDAVENVAATTPVEDPSTGQITIQSKVVSQQLQNGKRSLNSKEVLSVSLFNTQIHNFIFV